MYLPHYPQTSRNLLHPLNSLTSLAPSSPYGSQIKPLIHLPSANSTDPIPNGDGIVHRNSPTLLTGRVQISTSMQEP